MHLIIFAHPNNHTSFSSAVLQQIVEASDQKSVPYKIRDLYQLNFNPILSHSELQGTFQGITAKEVRYEQDLITQADLITLIFPLWWMHFPAILKGYLDRVLTYGFAYHTDENGQSVGLLSHKKIQLFMLMGNEASYYAEMGFDQALQKTLVDGIFHFCGIHDISLHTLDNIHRIDDNTRQNWLKKVKDITLKQLQRN